MAKLSFAMVNRFTTVNTYLLYDEQTVVDQQIPSYLVSSITLLDLPYNSIKHKQVGD